MAAQGSDLVLVERGGVLYKASASEIAALSSGLGTHTVPPGLAVGEYVTHSVNAAAAGTNAGAANRLDFVPYIPSKNITVDQLAIEVTTLVASSQARIGIYSSNASGVPDALLSGAGTLLDCGSTGSKTSAVSPSVTLIAGTVYWLAIHYSSTQTLRSLSVGSLLPLNVPVTGTTHNTGRRATATFASGLPNPAPSTSLISAAMGRVLLRKA